MSTLITLGSDFESLSDYFKTPFDARLEDLLKNRESKKIMVNMYNKDGIEGTYTVEIKGWIGTYKTTRERKEVLTDFPDNFISLYANKKLGEFNILPIVGKNKLAEVYIVGQLHVDIFELTELPDMALSNRQGYKTDNLRYQTVINYVSTELLPDILNMRTLYALLNKEGEEKRKLKKQHKDEETFKESVEIFKNNTAKNAAQNVASRLNIDLKGAQEIEEIFSDEINTNSSTLGIKSLVDSQKKKILISHTSEDKDLADVIYDMLLFNNVPPEDIIYTHANNEASRIPEGDIGGSGVYDYLREFFVDSYSTEKIYVIFVNSNEMRESWGVLVEVGAAWITQMEHKIFNIGDFRPEYSLDDRQQWHTSYRDSDKKLYMSGIDADIFSQKIEYICDKLGYIKKSREENYSHLNTLVKISDK